MLEFLKKSNIYLSISGNFVRTDGIPDKKLKLIFFISNLFNTGYK